MVEEVVDDATVSAAAVVADDPRGSEHFLSSIRLVPLKVVLL